MPETIAALAENLERKQALQLLGCEKTKYSRLLLHGSHRSEVYGGIVGETGSSLTYLDLAVLDRSKGQDCVRAFQVR